MDAGIYLAVCIAGVSGVAAITATLYRKYRPRFPVVVNCWFCNEDTKVPYGNRDCWDCPKCEQYNGFCQDGDYNKPIPAQYVEDFNFPIRPEHNSDSFNASSDVLCRRCQTNQILKIKQLANFVPHHEASFDQEVDWYKHHLEVSYKLCRSCEQNVYDELDKQDRELRRKYKNLDSLINTSHNSSGDETLDQSMDTSVVVRGLSVRLLCGLSWLVSIIYCILAVISALQHSGRSKSVTDVLPPEVITVAAQLSERLNVVILVGILSAVISIHRAGKERLQLSDASLCCSWLVGLLSSLASPWLPPHSYRFIQLVVSIATVIIATWVAVSPHRPKRSRHFVRTIKCRPSPQISVVSSTTRSHDQNRVSSNNDNDAESVASEEECFSDFETMSLGSPQKSKHRKPAVFGSYTRNLSSSNSLHSPNSLHNINSLHRVSSPVSSTSGILRHPRDTVYVKHSSSLPGLSPPVAPIFSSHSRKPLLSPARFRPKTPERHLIGDYNQPSTSKGPGRFTSNSVFGSLSLGLNPVEKSLWSGSLHSTPAPSVDNDDRGSMFSEPRDLQSDYDSDDSDKAPTHVSGSRMSTCTSVCPVDTTSRDLGALSDGEDEIEVESYQRVTAPVHRRRHWVDRLCQHPVLVLSVVINMILVLCVFTDSIKVAGAAHTVWSRMLDVVRGVLYHVILASERGLVYLKDYTQTSST